MLQKSKESDKIDAVFFGPKGENANVLTRIITKQISKIEEFRKQYHYLDADSINENIKNSKGYKESVNKLEKEIDDITTKLQNSSPFYSPYYLGHMNGDITMAGNSAYFATSLYNPNNVAYEGSPVTTEIEEKVGKQLCKLLRFNGDTSWGHITGCGSVANIESLWAARNAKYLVKSVIDTINNNKEFKDKGALDVDINIFGETKKLGNFSEWEILNIKLDDSILLVEKICNDKGIDKDKFNKSLEIYNIQYTGFVPLFGEKKIYPRVLVPASRHYSWDKAVAMLGLGLQNLIFVPLESNGRMNINKLEEELYSCADKKIPVALVVAVCGSTAEGAVDEIESIVEIRNKLRKDKKLEFVLHVDAAWGGYFCAAVEDARSEFVRPISPLSAYVYRQLKAICLVDSVTIDPHKSGYIQYPAGALCYRIAETRHLLTFSAPIIESGAGKHREMGTFGIEGSKPGAAVVATYVSHNTIGLNRQGYGQLLLEANFTAKIMWSYFVTAAEDSDPFVIAPIQGKPTNEELVKIRKLIINKSNDEIDDDDEAKKLLSEYGPDLAINQIGINFKTPIIVFENGKDRKINKSVDLANSVLAYLESSFNVDVSANTVSRKRPYFIRNTLKQPHYKSVIEHLASNLSLEHKGDDSLNVLVSTSMTPYATNCDVIKETFNQFRNMLLCSIGSVTDEAHLHGFVLTLADEKEMLLFGDHLPVFKEPQHQYHAIVLIKVSGNSNNAWDTVVSYIRKSSPEKPFVLGNSEHEKLPNIVKRDAELKHPDWFDGFPADNTKIPALKDTEVKIVDVIHFRHFDPKTTSHNTNETYVLHGRNNLIYLSNYLTVIPDFHNVLEVSEISNDIPMRLIESGCLVEFVDIKGKGSSGTRESPPLESGKWYTFSYKSSGGGIAIGKLKIKRNVWFDTEEINKS